MGETLKYGVATLAAGGVVLAASSELSIMAGMYAGGLAVLVGGGMVYTALEKWYCQNCGQDLGSGSRPERCGRCGSNRVGRDDPGAGRR